MGQECFFGLVFSYLSENNSLVLESMGELSNALTVVPKSIYVILNMAIILNMVKKQVCLNLPGLSHVGALGIILPVLLPFIPQKLFTYKAKRLTSSFSYFLKTVFLFKRQRQI